MLCAPESCYGRIDTTPRIKVNYCGTWADPKILSLLSLGYLWYKFKGN